MSASCHAPLRDVVTFAKVKKWFMIEENIMETITKTARNFKKYMDSGAGKLEIPR